MGIKMRHQKFFDTIDHEILFELIKRQIKDEMTRTVFKKIIESFFVHVKGKGIPIGNLISQIFANVYLHELDRYVKHELKIHHYYRYADDFIFLFQDYRQIEEIKLCVQNFLYARLCLNLHPNKIIIRKTHWGVDWLGVVICPDHELLRKTTKRRMIRNIEKTTRNNTEEKNLLSVLGSYNGLLQNVARKSIDEKIFQTVALYRPL